MPKNLNLVQIYVLYTLYISALIEFFIFTRASGDFLNGISTYKISRPWENYFVFLENINVKVGLRLVCFANIAISRTSILIYREI